MGLYKRGETWWYHFIFDGEHIQVSTRHSNVRVAREMEAAHKTRLAKERDERQAKAAELGCPLQRVARCIECSKWFDSARAATAKDGKKLCGDACRLAYNKKAAAVPTLAEFCRNRIEPWARAQYENTSRNTFLWYKAGIAAIVEHEPLSSLRFDEITTEHCAAFAAHRQSQRRKSQKKKTDDKPVPKGKILETSSVNASLRVLRRIMRLAVDWGIIAAAPKIKLLRGERHRDRVLTKEEELKYLNAAPQLLADIATVLADTGLRPDECYRLEWPDIQWSHGKHGAIFVRHGKTPAARRLVPTTARVRGVLDRLWEEAERPAEGFIFPAPTKSGHADHSTIKKQHARALKDSGVRVFTLYTFRHTFLTRLGESGLVDPWTLAKIAGHCSITMTSRYVHPGQDAVLTAIERLELPS